MEFSLDKMYVFGGEFRLVRFRGGDFGFLLVMGDGGRVEGRVVLWSVFIVFS